MPNNGTHKLPAVRAKIDDDAQGVTHRISNDPDVEVLTPEDLRAVFKDYGSIKLSVKRRDLDVTVPYDKGINASLRSIVGSHFNTPTKTWRVKLHAWRKLLALAPQIQSLNDEAWRSQFIEDAHLDSGDLRITVAEETSQRYPPNSITTYKGVPYTVTHVGRPFVNGDRAMCNIFLVANDIDDLSSADLIEDCSQTLEGSAISYDTPNGEREKIPIADDGLNAQSNRTFQPREDDRPPISAEDVDEAPAVPPKEAAGRVVEQTSKPLEDKHSLISAEDADETLPYVEDDTSLPEEVAEAPPSESADSAAALESNEEQSGAIADSAPELDTNEDQARDINAQFPDLDDVDEAWDIDDETDPNPADESRQLGTEEDIEGCGVILDVTTGEAVF